MVNNIRIFFHQERETYYNYSTGELKSVWQMLGVQILLAVVLTFFFKGLSDNFLGAILTIYSIFIGFSFSVLFNLVSTKKIVLDANDFLLEKRPRVEKINKLKDELFYNIIYFSVIGLALVVLVLLLVLLTNLNMNRPGFAGGS